MRQKKFGHDAADLARGKWQLGIITTWRLGDLVTWRLTGLHNLPAEEVDGDRAGDGGLALHHRDHARARLRVVQVHVQTRGVVGAVAVVAVDR